MYVDTQVRPQGEQQVGKMKLSEAIRKGGPNVYNRGFRISWCHCAIGAAHFAITGEVLNNTCKYTPGNIAEEWAEEHGFNPQAARRALQKHDSGMSHEQTADWLETQGL